MTVWKQDDRVTYRYSFCFKKQRYTVHRPDDLGRGRAVRSEPPPAAASEGRRELPGPEQTPRSTDWAPVYYKHAEKTVTRPERIDDLLRVVLRFWTARPSVKDPKNPPIGGEPYHALRLGDAIARPELLGSEYRPFR